MRYLKIKYLKLGQSSLGQLRQFAKAKGHRMRGLASLLRSSQLHKSKLALKGLGDFHKKQVILQKIIQNHFKKYRLIEKRALNRL